MSEEQKQEPKPEETKTEETKEEVKEEVKEDDSPKVENMPKEEKPKIPTDFTGDIEILNKLKSEGNSQINLDLDAALKKYDEGFQKLKEIMPKAYQEKEYNQQFETLNKLATQITSNLALAYSKKKEFEKSIELDISIISKDPLFDKSYARLFTSYKELGNLDQAVYFGGLLKQRFTPETLDKYKDLIKDIDEAEKEVNKKYAEIRAKQRKAMIKKIATVAVPILVLVGSFAIYYFKFRK